MIEQINHMAEIWWNWMGPMFWQVSLLIACLGAVDCCLRRHLWPQIRHAMWLLVLVKLLLPPTFALPTGLVSRLHPPADRALAQPYEASAAPLGLTPAEGFPRQGHGPEGYAEPGEDPASREAAAETSSRVTAAREVSARLSWEAMAMAGWLAIGLLLTVWLAAGYARLSRLHCGQSRQGQMPESFARLLTAVAQKLRLRRLPRVVVSPRVESPAVFGLFRPVLLLPAQGIENLSPHEAEHILLHELAHLKRRDLQVHALCIALQVIYWFNPLLYLVRRRLQHLRELCCDATVAGILQEGTRDYCRTLLETAERLLRAPSARGIGFLGLVENPGRLVARLQWLQKGPARHPRLRMASALLVGGLLFALLVPMAQAKKSAGSPAQTGSADSRVIESPSTSAPLQPASSSREKAISAATPEAPATGSVAGAPASDTVVDPNTGVRFTVAKRISAENDVIIHNNTVSLSSNGKFLLWRGRVTPLDGGKPFRLEGLGAPRDEAWSPDGKLIAYRSGSAIWLLPVSPETGQPTGPARKLGDDPAIWSNGVILWSADSEWIMLRYREQGNGLVPVTERCLSVRDGKLMQPLDYTRFSLRSPDQKSLAYFRPDNSVWTAPVGGGATRLVLGRRGGIVTVPLWWSPDGQWLLCGVSWDGYSYDDLRFVCLADHREIALKFPEQAGDLGVRVAGLGVSADGRKLQFFKKSYVLRTATKVAPIRGGGFAELPFSRQFDYIDIQEVRGPEGQGLVFAGCKRDRWALYVAPAGGGEPVEVKLNVSLHGDWGFWLVSPDGKRLFVADYTIRGQPRPVGDLYIIPISLEQAQSTGPATPIAKEWERSNHYYPHDDMAWSPDSNRLAIYGGPKGDRDLWVVPADGRPPRRITQNREDYLPSVIWSPDGKFIAYSVESPGRQFHLYTVSAEGGAPKRLWTESGSGGWSYTWSPDSKEIEVDSKDGLVSVAIADGSVRPFLKLAEAHLTWLDWLEWSPDGQTLAFFGGNDDGYQTSLYRASDKKAELLPPDPAYKNTLGWTGDSQAIFCVAEQPDKIHPAALVYEVDLVDAWTRAKNSVVDASLSASASPTTQPEVPPLVNGEFRDDFEDGDTRYWTFQDLPNQVPYRVREVQNGELVLENCFACLDAPEWTNYAVTVKMCIKRVVADSGFGGVHFRRGERGATYGAGANGVGTPTPRLTLATQYSGTNTWFHGGTLAERPYDFAIGKWYTLQVEVNGPRIVVRVDGHTLIDVSDESFSQGSVRLLSNGARVHFDDFSVRLLP